MDGGLRALSVSVVNTGVRVYLNTTPEFIACPLLVLVRGGSSTFPIALNPMFLCFAASPVIQVIPFPRRVG